ncbi:MAG: metallophosphoesterase [Clostridia bacterium]|nr:metallophosphoesterase [Clostridia bacterium]
MAMPFFIEKYMNQFKAMNPKYDVLYEVSDKDPITFEDSENVRLSMAIIADTHLPNRESAELNLKNTFIDIGNSKESFDAFLIAGDIADYGTKNEYKRFFRVLDEQKAVPHLFVTMGNHDARIFFKQNTKILVDKINDYLKLGTDKVYYSYDIKGYTFIVLCTEKRILEKAYISPEQIAFLDKELERGTKDGKPVFVMCHQPFSETHGLPEVWKTGDMGEQNDEVRAVMEKYRNVFFINGHLHGGIFEKVAETINEENGVWSISIPGYRKLNNFGIQDCGTGYFCEVYDDRVVFRARKFISGEYLQGDYTRLEYAVK